MKKFDSLGEVPFVDLQLQHRNLETEINAAISRVLSSSEFILGSEVTEFEREFATFHGARRAVGVANGLDALRLSLMALGVGSGDEVIVPANTFIATALAVSAVGARPVFVDCEADTYQISTVAAESAVTHQTKAIIPVHMMGQPCDMDGLTRLAAAHRLAVIEDACQAHGALVGSKHCGTLGDAGCFSFYPAKNLGALGDGGAIVTDRDELARVLSTVRHYGQREKNRHDVQGCNSRLDTLQAAILRIKLRYLTGWNQRRRQHAARYRALLEGVGDLRFQRVLPGATPVYHLFVVETAYREALQNHLRSSGIQTGIHYPVPIHLQPAYSELRHGPGSFPVAEGLANRMLSLPMYPELEAGQIERVAEKIREFFGKTRNRR